MKTTSLENGVFCPTVTGPHRQISSPIPENTVRCLWPPKSHQLTNREKSRFTNTVFLNHKEPPDGLQAETPHHGGTSAVDLVSQPQSPLSPPTKRRTSYTPQKPARLWAPNVCIISTSQHDTNRVTWFPEHVRGTDPRHVLEDLTVYESIKQEKIRTLKLCIFIFPSPSFYQKTHFSSCKK